MPPFSSDNKTQERARLRRKLRARRRALTPAYRRHAAAAAARRLTALPEFHRARRIAAYWTHGPEIDTAALITRMFKQNKVVYFPLLGPPPAHRLRFAAWRKGEKLTPNRYGIPEPGPQRMLRPRFLDMIVVPLVGFDAAGNRIGMGGGYYDRTLEYLSRRRQWHKPRLIGFAYDCQRVPRLPFASWDMPLDAIVTESEWVHPHEHDR